VKTAVHSRSVVNRVSHVFEVFKDDEWSWKLRHPLDYVPRHFVQTVVNVVPFFSLHDRLKGGLIGLLHPLSLGEKLVALFFDRWILEHHGVFHVTVSGHRSERNTIFVYIHADDRVRVVFTADPMSFVGDGHVQSPLVVFVNDFSCPNSPPLITEGSPQTTEVVRTAAKFAFDVRTSYSRDTEANRILILDEETIAFSVVHYQRVHPVLVWIWTTPAVIGVIEIGFDFTEGFVNDELAGVFDVISVLNNN